MRLWLKLLTAINIHHFLQRQIQFGELTEVEQIAEGGFGVIYCAKHDEWGTVVYKELKSSFIRDGTRFDRHFL